MRLCVYIAGDKICRMFAMGKYIGKATGFATQTKCNDVENSGGLNCKFNCRTRVKYRVHFAKRGAYVCLINTKYFSNNSP